MSDETPSGGGRPLTAHEALLYVLDPRNDGPAFSVMGYNVETDDPIDVWSGVTLSEVGASIDPDHSFDAEHFASYGPFELWFVEDPGPAQPTTIENVIYVAMEAGEYHEVPATTIARIVALLRQYGFVKAA